MGDECIGREYDKKHVCSGPVQPNHTLINKAKIRGVKDRLYFDKAINISWCCQKFHNEHGETRKFREWFKARQIWRYGRQAVKDFFEKSPQRVKERFYD
jgi:hypothetical protein